MIDIRKGNRNDIDSITYIESECFPESEAASKKDIIERMNVFASHFFVAQINGKVVGFVNGSVSNESTINDEMYKDVFLHNENGKYQLIFGLDVLPEYRNEGIAHALMQAIISSAINEGRKGVILTCKQDLISFYEKIGFQNKGVSKSIHGGVVWYDMELKFVF